MSPRVVLDWFWQPRRADGLAAIRIVLGGYGLFYLESRYKLLSRTAELPSDLFRPVGLARLLSVPLPPEVVGWLIAAAVVLNVAFLLGAAFRVTGPAFALLMMFLLSYRNSFGMVHHSHNLFALHLLVVGVSHAADSLSLDRLFGSRRSSTVPATDWRYGWPVALVMSVTAMVYFLAGVAKVLGPAGWGWASGEVVRSQVAVNLVRKHLFGEASSPLGEMLYPYVAVFTFVGVMTLVVEIGAPLFLVNRRLLAGWAIATFGMHYGIAWIMGIHFDYQMSGAMFAAYVPWSPLFDHLRTTTTRLTHWSPLRNALGHRAEAS